MNFNSQYQLLGDFKSDWDQSIVKNEPMLFNCDRESALRFGGPITQNFLENMPSQWQNCDIVIDSRVHMLMPNWFSCIPGYHHDDIPRTNNGTGQPNYIDPEYYSIHLMGLVNGDICPTQFAVGEIELDLPPEGEVIYKHWHKAVVSAIDQGVLKTESAPSGKYVQFDCDSFHQGVAATKSGWRWFIRVSADTDRTKHCTNELRRQVQVYMANPMEGW